MKIRNWVKQDTATSGTGTITLGAAVAKSITMAEAGVANGELVPYSIIDGSNRESGVGTYTSAGTLLARTHVRETLVAGTFNNTTATAITLSGTAVVSISPDSSTLMPMLAGFDPIGTFNYVRGAFKTGVSATFTFTVDRAYWSEFIVTGSVELAGVGYEITTTKTVGTTSHVGLFEYNPISKTITLVEQVEITDLTTGIKTASFSANRVLTTGVYLLGMGTDSDIIVRSDSSRMVMIQCMSNDLTSTPVGFISITTYSAGAGLPTSITGLDHNNLRSATVPQLFAVGV